MQVDRYRALTVGYGDERMSDFGGYIWFVGLGLSLIMLTAAIAVASLRKSRGRGDPNRAWKEEAAASGHSEVAQTNAKASDL